MSFSFFGSDFAPFVFGRAILKKNQKANLRLLVRQKEAYEKDFFQESDFWETLIRLVVSRTRFGRIGIFFERKNENARSFCQKIHLLKIEYKPKNTRSEKKVEFHFFETQVLHEMANEGLADTVEFRRLTRKFIRRAKHARCDSIIFLDAIFGDEICKKILQHVAGTQMRIFTVEEILDAPFFEEKEKQKIEIMSDDDAVFTKKRAEEILKIKIRR